jgi:hypothetical protein
MTDHSDIEKRIANFHGDLVALSDDIMFQKHIVFGDSYALSPEQYFELKHQIAVQFGLHSTQVILVGSAKLGFSIAPNKQYQFFGDKSDLDIAVVSEDFFSRLWSAAFEYWNDGGYWERHSRFNDYLFRGWLRPDCLPPTVESALQWFEYFRQLTASKTFGPFKISAGVYKSWWFLERYQQQGIARCRQTVRVQNGYDSD